jgi:potassium efflux system protein
MCIDGGVADRHFRWNSETVSLLRHNFDWLLVGLVPLGFVASAAYNHPDTTYSGSLGRLSLIALTLGFALFFARVLGPRKGALRNLIAERPDGWFSRSRRLWYPLAVATPLVLAALTAVGYIHTAGVLLGSLVSSMYLFLAITVIHQLIVRWLGLTRRRLALQAALGRRAARAAEEADQNEESGTTAAGTDELEAVDYASLDEQTRRLINTLLFIGGAVTMWAIWANVLPAFAIFEEVALWHQKGVVDGEERIIPVTLADIGLVLVIVFVATLAVKNLPALLEILLLSRLSLSPGSRYAVTTMTGYLITAVAVFAAFGTLGLSWGQLQWLVAALGVGIGFGLQEIVANFISGIIILFERPIRVGDVVTVGDTTGAVAKIRIRATTIRNWDKQELLVPNKEFITGRLLNWTLSDTLNRVVIPVGVDYGSDIPLALKLLEEAVRENENVLNDPAPLFTFEGFGDNALNLVVRCYLQSLDNRLATISALHQSINEKLRAAGISIAFPQRDVHLSTARPLDVRVHQTWPEKAEPGRRKGAG